MKANNCTPIPPARWVLEMLSIRFYPVNPHRLLSELEQPLRRKSKPRQTLYHSRVAESGWTIHLAILRNEKSGGGVRYFQVSNRFVIANKLVRRAGIKTRNRLQREL